MTDAEFKQVSQMLKDLENNIVRIFRDKEIELEEMMMEECPECEKLHNPNTSCLEAGAIRNNL